jgi:hypothetical protein
LFPAVTLCRHLGELGKWAKVIKFAGIKAD